MANNKTTLLRRPAQIIRRSRHAQVTEQQQAPEVVNVFEQVVAQEARVQVQQPKAPAQVQAATTPPPAKKKAATGTTTQNVVTLRGKHDCLKLLREGKVQALVVPINPDGCHPTGSMTDQVCRAYPDFERKYHSYVLTNEIKLDSVLWYRDARTGHMLIGIVVRARAILPIDAKIVSRTLGKIGAELSKRGIQSLAISKITRGPESGDPDWNEHFGQMVCRHVSEFACSVVQIIGGRDTRWYLEHGEMYGETPEQGTATLS